MSLTIHSIYKYFDSTVQRAEDRGQKFHFCRLPFAVNVMLNLSIITVSSADPTIKTYERDPQYLEVPFEILMIVIREV